MFEQTGRVRGVSSESVGVQKLKNIRQPVQVYRVTLVDSIDATAADARMGSQWSASETRDWRPSIAVLPLRDLGRGVGDTYFADGIVEDIIVSLTGLKELVVISRSSTVAYAGRDHDVREVGHTLLV